MLSHHAGEGGRAAAAAALGGRGPPGRAAAKGRGASTRSCGWRRQCRPERRHHLRGCGAIVNWLLDSVVRGTTQALGTWWLTLGRARRSWVPSLHSLPPPIHLLVAAHTPQEGAATPAFFHADVASQADDPSMETPLAKQGMRTMRVVGRFCGADTGRKHWVPVGLAVGGVQRRAYTQWVEPKLALIQVQLPPPKAFIEDWQPTPDDHIVSGHCSFMLPFQMRIVIPCSKCVRNKMHQPKLEADIGIGRIMNTWFRVIKYSGVLCDTFHSSKIIG
ncbi:unnamed protein product [Urochloa humidicola]